MRNPLADINRRDRRRPIEVRWRADGRRYSRSFSTIEEAVIFRNSVHLRENRRGTRNG